MRKYKKSNVFSRLLQVLSQFGAVLTYFAAVRLKLRNSDPNFNSEFWLLELNNAVGVMPQYWGPADSSKTHRLLLPCRENVRTDYGFFYAFLAFA